MDFGYRAPSASIAGGALLERSSGRLGLAWQPQPQEGLNAPGLAEVPDEAGSAAVP